MLIIDMPIPVKEWNCPDCKALCVDMFRHYCGITKKTIDTLKNMRARPDWCPIKGVLPEQHGDLVDADTVLWGEEVPDSEGIVVPVTIGDVIEGYDVQIVIAAERSKT